MSTAMKRVLREELRMWGAIAGVGALWILSQVDWAALHDAKYGRPFISATVEIVASPDRAPRIRYKAHAREPVKGQWTAVIYSEDGTRLSSRRGEGNYKPNNNDAKLWSWSDFFDGPGQTLPEVPEAPFSICVFYTVQALDSGVWDRTPESCSEIFDPNN